MTEFTVRPATVHDVNAVFHLTNDHAQAGLMLPRSKYKIITMLNNFSVVETAGKEVVACVGLFTPNRLSGLHPRSVLVPRL